MLVLSARVAPPRADHVDHGMNGKRLMLGRPRDSAAIVGHYRWRAVRFHTPTIANPLRLCGRFSHLQRNGIHAFESEGSCLTKLMSTRNRTAFAAPILLFSLWIACDAIKTEGMVPVRVRTLVSAGALPLAAKTERQICDVDADYALGVEDYPKAIRLHSEIVRKFPKNALAHYHLGFAQGMMGNRTEEIREYQRAEALGMRNWDLFLNLGLAQSENGDLGAATDSLHRAVLLGGEHSESHFDLALLDERRGMLADAEEETLASLRLKPGQPDARNLLGVIYAREGKTVRASLIWRELVREAPYYDPARTNLAILRSQSLVALVCCADVDQPLREFDFSRRNHHPAGGLRQRGQIHFLHPPAFVS